MPAHSKLLLPPRDIASCIAAAVYRDTRGVDLTDDQRMNFFPATPLVTITVVLHGQLHMNHGVCQHSHLRAIQPLPPLSIVAPSETPIVSWSPGAVVAITLAFFPDAWSRLVPEVDIMRIPDGVQEALQHLTLDADIEADFARACKDLVPLWQKARGSGLSHQWTGSDRIEDWTRHVITRSMLAEQGRSLRAVQRLIKSWTGQSRQSLEFYAKLEQLHQVRHHTPKATLAETALDANFADQSHMGRSLKRATGFSPGALNDKIENDEAFWCYRLLGERF